MKAIIVAAGTGSRLRPYTDSVPKCMVNIVGRPMIERQLETLKTLGIDDVTIIGGYRSEVLESLGLDLVLNPRFDKTNMVSTLFCAEDRMRAGEDLLILYGDIVYEPRVLRKLVECEGDVCITADAQWERVWRLRMDDPLQDAESFRHDADMNVIELGRKPKGYEDIQAQYMGLIKVSGDAVERLIDTYRGMDRSATYDGKDFDNMYMTSFIQYLIDSGWQVKVALVENGWLEIDSVEDLETYERMHSEGTLDEFCRL